MRKRLKKHSGGVGGVPLHLMVFTRLRNSIFRGAYPELSALPSEAMLEEKFGVSRITIRRALDELAARGLVDRGRGRVTRVRARRSATPVVAEIRGSLVRNVLAGLETKSEMLEFGYVPASMHVAARLELPGKASVQMAVRLRTRGDMPLAHVTSWIPEQIGRLFELGDMLDTSVLDLLEKHGLRIVSVEQTVSADAADRDVARALRLTAGSPVLKVERIVRAEGGVVAESSSAIYPAECHQYRITLRQADVSESEG